MAPAQPIGVEAIRLLDRLAIEVAQLAASWQNVNE
jgi:hypothetical protein